MNYPYLYLGFDDLVNKEAEVTGYSLFLINNTSYKIVFQFEWKYTAISQITKGDGFLQAGTNKRVAVMDRSQLNDKPVFQINIQLITTSGKDSWRSKEVKIKAKQFFSKQALAPQFDRKMHLYELFTEFEKQKKSKDNSLRHYTKQHQAPTNDKPLFQGTLTDLKDLSRIASFPKLIDLHKEKLLPGSKKLSGAVILSHQLKAFDSYLEEAIILGVSPFFVIHGKGAGRLEEEIRIRLETRNEVDSFEGGFHQGFGAGGATKVFLKE